MLFIIAVTPGIAVAVFLYIKDKYEPEPVKTLMLSFGMGVLALVLSLGLSLFFQDFVEIDKTDLGHQVFKAFFLVALIEELSKFIFLRGFLYYHIDFNEPLDGIIYAVMIGMGFATVENIIYVFYAGGGGATGILRMFTAIPAHAFFAILMGYFIGRAKYAPSSLNGLYSLLGLLVAMLFHGVYDYFLFISFIPGIWIWSFVALFIAFVISGKAIHVLQGISPFKPKHSEKGKRDDKETEG